MNKQQIVDAFWTNFEALVAEVPRQEVWRKHHAEWLENAKLGFLARRIRTKGGYTDLAADTPVLFLADKDPRLPGMVSIYAGKGHNRTLVPAKAVEAECEFCHGHGSVRHKRGLVEMRCPMC